MFLLLASVAEAATVRFVAPQPGAQLVGVQAIEIATDVASIDRVEFHVDGTLAGVARKPPYRMAFDFGTTPKARVVEARVLSHGFRKSQSARFEVAASGATDTYDVDVVEVPLRIRTSRPVSAADLRVSENGVEQQVRQILPTRGAAHFVFVVDRSLSMSDGRLAAAFRAIDAARRLLREDDTSSLILFNHIVGRPQPIAAGLARTASSLKPSGGTSLRDAVASAAARQRTYTIVISDGGDRNSLLAEEEALRRVSGMRSVVSGIVLGSGSSFLEKAARNTGGRVVAATASTIQRALNDLLIDINSRYLLVYQSSGTEKGWRSIAVTPRRSSIDVATARRGYFTQ